MKLQTDTEIKSFRNTLTNGLTVVAVEMPHVHTIEVAMFVRAGLRFENEKNNGISHFLEHMMFRGNRKYPDSISLNLEFEKIGRDLRASTLSEYTYYGFSPHYDQLERGMELFAEFFTDPTFPHIEVERGIILEECLEDLNAEGENIDINNVACDLMYPGNSLALPTIGTEESIRSIDAAMLRDYFEQYYCPSNIVLIGAGCLAQTQFHQLAQTHFGKIPRRGTAVPKDYFLNSVREDQTEPQFRVQEDVDSQDEVQICFRSVSYNHPDYYAASLISRLFDDGVSSRLQKVLREEQGLAYSVECRATSLADIGTIDFDVTVRPEKVSATVQVIFGEIKKFLDSGATLEELDHVKKRYMYDLALELDDPGKQAARYGFSELYSKVITLEEERDLVESITLEDIRRMAESVFKARNLNVVLVGPHTPQSDGELERLTREF
ncbi:MAG TPA: pitrilysin family protein [Desulfobacteria bacterium]|nr:pitrilysin family protein [Desulfobacteria bacterium]